MSAERAPRFQRPCALSLAVEERGSTVFLRMTGVLDLAATRQVSAALDRVDSGRITLLVFDLGHVEFLDLAGLRTILRAADYGKEHDVHVTVIKPDGLASRVFTLTGAHRELDLLDSQTD